MLRWQRATKSGSEVGGRKSGFCGVVSYYLLMHLLREVKQSYVIVWRIVDTKKPSRTEFGGVVGTYSGKHKNVCLVYDHLFSPFNLFFNYKWSIIGQDLRSPPDHSNRLPPSFYLRH